MSIFLKKASIEQIAAWIPPILRLAGIEAIKIDHDSGSLSADFTVSDNNVQPHGILHGGVSVLIAETLGSIGGNLCLEQAKVAVGQTLSASHIRPAAKGEKLRAVCSAVHIGKKSHVWNTDLTDQKGRLICRVALTLAVIQG